MQLRSGVFVLAVAVIAAAVVAADESADDAFCRSGLSSTDAAFGVSASHDLACRNNTYGVGCFADACRFCRNYTTVISESFVPCNTTTGNQTSETIEFEGAVDCTVSPGDRGVGLAAFYDTTCPSGNGGLGCQANKCRFCKMWKTPASQVYADCPSAGTTSSPVTTSASPTPVTTAPTSAPASGSDNCANRAVNSGMTSVAFVTERKCNTAKPLYTGCVPNTNCQLCRSAKNEANQYLISCRVLQASKNTESLLAFSIADVANAAQVSTSLAGVPSDAETSASGADAAAWIGTSIGVAAACVFAVVAIWKLKKAQKERDFRGPCTPLNGSLISLETCVSNL